jgi:hypothetical protein
MGSKLKPSQQRLELKVVPFRSRYVVEKHIHRSVVEHLYVCPTWPAMLQPFDQRPEQ